ncbi:MAG: O-methyltransferase [Chloroflexota bacterium]|nr:O-methyltransferase [Chloroflexota bacterium]
MDEKLAALLKELELFSNANDSRATDRGEKMLNITPDTGAFLALLVRALRARRILEIGTSNGYSTLWLAYAVRSLEGRIVTVEKSRAKSEMAQANFARAGLAMWIEPHLIDAGSFLKAQPPASFDFVFLDSDRGEYVAWWQDLQRVLASGGMMVVDNAVSHAGELQEFTAAVRAASGYLTALVPVGKGEFLILKESSK